MDAYLSPQEIVEFGPFPPGTPAEAVQKREQATGLPEELRRRMFAPGTPAFMMESFAQQEREEARGRRRRQQKKNGSGGGEEAGGNGLPAELNAVLDQMHDDGMAGGGGSGGSSGGSSGGCGEHNMFDLYDESPLPPRGCDVCARSDKKLLLCGGCKTRSYCSKECQASSWKGEGGGHKKECGLVKKARCVQKMTHFPGMTAAWEIGLAGPSGGQSGLDGGGTDGGGSLDGGGTVWIMAKPDAMDNRYALLGSGKYVDVKESVGVGVGVGKGMGKGNKERSGIQMQREIWAAFHNTCLAPAFDADSYAGPRRPSAVTVHLSAVAALGGRAAAEHYLRAFGIEDVLIQIRPDPMFDLPAEWFSVETGVPPSEAFADFIGPDRLHPFEGRSQATKGRDGGSAGEREASNDVAVAWLASQKETQERLWSGSGSPVTPTAADVRKLPVDKKDKQWGIFVAKRAASLAVGKPETGQRVSMIHVYSGSSPANMRQLYRCPVALEAASGCPAASDVLQALYCACCHPPTGKPRRPETLMVGQPSIASMGPSIKKLEKEPQAAGIYFALAMSGNLEDLFKKVFGAIRNGDQRAAPVGDPEESRVYHSHEA